MPPGSNAPEWITRARDELLRLAEPGAGWGYRKGGTCCVEPTALACLALRSARAWDESQPASAAVKTATRWIASIQQPGGALGVSAALPSPEWPTAHALLAWASEGGFAEERRKAADWLLQRRGRTSARAGGGAVGHDTTLAGWPWVGETHSWLEPTAMAVLALRRQGLGDHPRTREGLRLIADRAIASGGWNFGNSSVYGKDLRPQPSETGLALLALSGTRKSDGIVEGARGYLERTLPGLRSAQSLCWGLLGLAAWGLRPSEGDRWLAEGYDLCVRRSDPISQLAYLLLAAGENTLSLLGVQAR